jgi:hypothetical protein
MTREPNAQFDAPPIEAGRQVAHLRHVLGLVAKIAGAEPTGDTGYEALDEAARISAAYEASIPVARRPVAPRLEVKAARAAVTVAALAAAQQHSGPPRAAAAQLAGELEAALRELARTVQAG